MVWVGMSRGRCVGGRNVKVPKPGLCKVLVFLFLSLSFVYIPTSDQAFGIQDRPEVVSGNSVAHEMTILDINLGLKRVHIGGGGGCC